VLKSAHTVETCGPRGCATSKSVSALASHIVTQLPYLRHLICDYNDVQVRTRRIHLV